MNTDTPSKLRTVLEKKGISQAEFARLMNIYPQKVTNWINRGVPNNMAMAVAIALGVSVKEIAQDGLSHQFTQLVSRGTRDPKAQYPFPITIDAWDDPDEEDADHVSRPLFMNAELAAGSGKLDTATDEGYRIKFSRRTLSKCGVQPENAYGMKVSGNSMEPVIPDGATAGIDAGNTAIKDGKLYAILHGEMLRVKLLYKLPGNRVRIASYNKDEYPDEVESLEGGNLKVLGRVFWYSVLI